MKLKKKMLLPILAVLFILMGITVAAFATGTETTPVEEGSLDVYKCNLSFRSNVCIKYAIPTTDTSVRLLIWRAPQTEYTYGTQAAVLATVGSETVDEIPCLIYDYTELAAKEMTAVVYARAFRDNGDGGYEYGDVKKYSILQYAYNKLGYTGTASTDEELKQMLRDMLVYGASAQKYFDWELDRLATADFYQVVVEGGVLADGCTDGLYLPGESVTLIAPATNESGRSFLHWVNSAGETVGETATYALSVPVTHDTYTAVYNPYSQGLKFTSNGDGTCYVSGIGVCTDTDIQIPPISPDGDSVTAIGKEAFGDCSDVQSVIIPEGVTRIDDYAFLGCKGMLSISIPSSVASLGKLIFSGCHELAYIQVAEGNAVYHANENCLIETASKTLIAGCRTSVIPTDGSVTAIGAYAFYNNTSMMGMEIPGCVTSIGEYAFGHCPGFVQVLFSGPSELETIGKGAFYYTALLDIQIPKGVQRIEENTFLGCTRLASVTFAEGSVPVAIECGAFSGCTELTELDIPLSVTSIQATAFSDCTGLIQVENGVSYVGKWAIDCDLDSYSASLRDGTYAIAESAFNSCHQMQSVFIPASVTRIGNHAFAFCENVQYFRFGGTEEQWNAIIKEYNWNYNVGVDTAAGTYTVTFLPTYSEGLTYTSNGDGTCYVSGIGSCKDTDIIIPTHSPNGDKVTAIGDNAFYDCIALTSVVLPNSVTKIGAYSFYGCYNLNSVTIPNGVTSIGAYSFCNCKGLTTIEIPESMSRVDDSAFSGCNKLVEMWNYSSLSFGWVQSLLVKHAEADETRCVTTTDDGYIFYENGSSVYLLGYIGDESELILPSFYNEKRYSLYMYTFYKNDKITHIEIPDNVTAIGSSAFYACSNLTGVKLPARLTAIEDSTFKECGKLESILIPSWVLDIGDQAFSGCGSLSTVTFEDGSKLASIGREAFRGCSEMTTIVLPDNITTIEPNVFSDCRGLVDVVLPSCLESIPDGTFSDCRSLESIVIPNDVTSVGERAFYNCESLTSIAFESINQLISIGDNAFYSCSRLSGIVLPTSVESIGNRAFYSCSSLTNIVIPRSVSSIGYGAFNSCSRLKSVTFENIGGWYYTEDSEATSGTGMNVANASANATNLKGSTYYGYWKRS